ncbi:acyl-CoA dehydrogenase family protein, partial [Bordetella pertussis]|uniref:acyl-CoA dehydrogenase family protein n=1 Tax=Bordetella pertussis TaxID=520 RepID=UPI000A8EB3CB
AAQRRDCGLHGEPTADLSWDAGVRQDAVRIATAAAFRAGLAQPALLPAAIAKARASEAAALAANTAHAVHGAIGVTEEYDLQLYTRRLHGWRLAHGSEAYWHQVVGAALMGSGDGAVQFVRGL